MARAAPQRAAEQASKAAMPLVSSGPLLAAKELLRNTPDPAASPEVLRQWRDNVDRLLNLAQSSPGSMGGSVSRQRHRQGRVTMEWARERRFNIEGRNLDAELNAAAPRPCGHTQAPVAGVGCVALADHLRVVAWPSKFRPHLPEMYNGSTNP